MNDFVTATPVPEGADMSVIEQKRKALEQSILAAIEEGVRRGYEEGCKESQAEIARLREEIAELNNRLMLHRRQSLP